MGKYHCTIDLLFDWFGISCMTSDNFCFYLQKRLIQKCQTGVNFTNILWAAFAPKCFWQTITNPNFMHLKTVQRTLVWLSISPIFYQQLFHTKVLCTPFMYLQVGFVIFWRKDFGTKAVHKMLVKLTPGGRQYSDTSPFSIQCWNIACALYLEGTWE